MDRPEFLDHRDGGRPVLVPMWLLLSGISPQAVTLYGLYSLGLDRQFDARAVGAPQSLQELAVALHLTDVDAVQTAHRELLAVGAVEETHDNDRDGTTLFLIHQSSPSEREADDERRRRWEQLRATARQDSPTDTKPRGEVYVIRETASGLIKIGYSTEISKRLANLQRSNPNKLELLWSTPGGLDLEAALHQRFRKRRLHSEWFDFGRYDPVKQIRRAVEQIQAT